MPSWVVVGPGDDAAVIAPERGALEVLTTDAQVEGVHFDHRFVPPDAIGHRALAVNLSDLAAMGAKPRAALLSLVLPDALDVAVVDGMLDGLLALAARARRDGDRRQHLALARAARRGRDGCRHGASAPRADARRRTARRRRVRDRDRLGTRWSDWNALRAACGADPEGSRGEPAGSPRR